MDDSLEFLNQNAQETPETQHSCIMYVNLERCVRPAYYFSVKNPRVQLCIDHAREFHESFVAQLRRKTDHLTCVCWKNISLLKGIGVCAAEADYMWRANKNGEWRFICRDCLRLLSQVSELLSDSETYKFR